MSRPTLSLLIPTHREDRPLRRALESVEAQLKPGDEVIVIGDTFDGPLTSVEELVKDFGTPYRYVSYAADHHCWGHCQINLGISLAKGDYIHVSDDDDVWCPDALQTFRQMASAVPSPRPFLFRFKSYVGPIFWVKPGLFARDWIGGHCLLAPNVPGKVGRFACAYNGDFDWLESTVQHYGGPENAVWREEIVCVARPS